MAGATEEAANTIMETMERNGGLPDKLREGISAAPIRRRRPPFSLRR